MSLIGRVRYRRYVKGKKLAETARSFVIAGEGLSRADWEEFLQEFKALLRKKNIKIRTKS